MLINNVSGSFVAYGFSVLFDPFQRELGWSTAAIALAFLLRSEVRSIGAPVTGFLGDRFGPRAMIGLGLGVMGIGFLLLSRAETLVAFYDSFIVISLGSTLAILQSQRWRWPNGAGEGR